MPATLCITGYDFNVDEYLSKADWENLEVSIRHKGDKIGHFGRLGIFEYSGFFIEMSAAKFDDFPRQQKDVIDFLEKYRENFELLSAYVIDGLRYISFGLETHPPNRFSKTYRISSQLSRLAGEFGLEIEMVNYFTYNDKYLTKKAKKRWPLRKKYQH